jgi:hypothetical protein
MDHETGHATPVELNAADFRALRESGRTHSEYDHRHLVERTLYELDQRDIDLWHSEERHLADIKGFDPFHSSQLEMPGREESQRQEDLGVREQGARHLETLPTSGHFGFTDHQGEKDR